MVIGVDINDTLRDFSGQFEYVYRKFIDPTFELGEEGVWSNDYSEVFPFVTKDEYEQFRYTDCPFELYARADACSKTVNANFNKWTGIDLMDVDKEKVPEIILFSPLEANLTIQATYSYLSANLCRARTMHFPVDSTKMWDKCDIIITANPTILEAKPEGKVSFKILTDYNKETEADYTFDSMDALMDDADKTIIKLIEQ